MALLGMKQKQIFFINFSLLIFLINFFDQFFQNIYENIRKQFHREKKDNSFVL